jgi:hypothetical protein
MHAPGRRPDERFGASTLSELARRLGLDLGYGGPGRSADLGAALERFRDWWAEHREGYRFP